MTGMALFQGLLDREGRVLDKANRLARAGFASLDANAPARAAGAFLKALGLLEAIEPTARTGDFADSFANVGTGLLRVGRFESAQAAATRALSADGGNANGWGCRETSSSLKGRPRTRSPTTTQACASNPRRNFCGSGKATPTPRSNSRPRRSARTCRP